MCDECGRESGCYVGETGQNPYTRGLKHMANYKGKHEDSPLWKHSQTKHSGGMNTSYSMKVVKYCREPLTRQVNEGVRITRCKANTKLNSKSEWYGPATVRVEAGAECDKTLRNRNKLASL